MSVDPNSSNNISEIVSKIDQAVIDFVSTIKVEEK